MIRYKNVKKIYPGNIKALDGITFDIDEGEFTFVVGPSGAGKSTILRLLVKQEVPSAGDIFFEDVMVPTIPNKLLSIYRQQLGIVFQDLKLIPSKTVQENIQFALEISGKHKDEVFETTKYLLDVVNLTGRSHLFPEELSGGEKQKVAIARALANDPKLFVADEPTGNLDKNTAFEILGILKAINDWGTTVMVITHDDTLVDNLKTRVLTLEQGKIASDVGRVRKKEIDSFSKLIESLNKETKRILKINGMDTVDELLKLSEDDAIKMGIKEEQFDEISNKLEKLLKK